MNIIKNQLTFKETIAFVDGVVNCVFDQDDEGNDIGYSPVDLQPLIQSTFAKSYTDIEFGDNFEENFEKYMGINIDSEINGCSNFNKSQYAGILKAIDEGISYRKQRLLDSQSAQSQMYSAITGLINTLNSKASELNMKSLEKQLSKLNVKELMKEYSKSNIGKDLRDKAIQDLGKENKDLRNEISARNVKVVK